MNIRPAIFILLVCLFPAATESFASLPLTISSQGINNIVITWPNSGNYVLQTNVSLATASWGRDNAPIVNNNGTNSVTIEPSSASEFFRLENIYAITIASPTNIAEITEFWNYNDLATNPTNDVSIGSWTDEINDVVLKTYEQAPVTMATLPDLDTNIDGAPSSYWSGGYTYPYYAVAPGLMFLSYVGPNSPHTTASAMTNASGALTVVNSNFTFWVAFRSFFPTNNNTWWIWSDANGHGICIESNVVSSVWNGKTNYSSFALTDPSYDAFGVGYGYGINYDIIDAGGTLYSNGVEMAQGIGQPTNGFRFNALGSYSNSLMGAIQYIGIWTNYTFSAVDTSNLNAWYWNYNNSGSAVTNVTNGLVAWWKLNDGTGTTAADSWSTNRMIFGGSGTVWTNTGPLYGESLCFNGNGWTTNVNTLLADGCPNLTVTAWVCMSTNSFSVYSDGPISGIGSISKCTSYGPGWYIWANDPGLSGTTTPYSGWGAGDADGQEYVGHYLETCCSWDGLDVPTFPAVGDQNWHFISMVMSNYLLAFYVDGAQYVDNGTLQEAYISDSLAPTNTSCPTIPITLGGELNTANQVDLTDWIGIPGIMEDVRIYNRVLTQQELNDLFKWRGQAP
jgi:hypothetical protein